MEYVYIGDEKIEYEISKDNIKIIDSYRIKDKKLMKTILEILLMKDPYRDSRDRSLAQYVREWRSHNIMYHIPLKFFKEHCGDCDLSMGESKFRLFVYSILGRF